jgi:hypothetical protein
MTRWPINVNPITVMVAIVIGLDCTLIGIVDSIAISFDCISIGVGGGFNGGFDGGSFG